MVGRSIASIYDQSAYIFTEAQSAKVNMSAKVHLLNLHLVLYMHLNKGVNPGTQSVRNKHVGIQQRKCALNRRYALAYKADVSNTS